MGQFPTMPPPELLARALFGLVQCPNLELLEPIWIVCRPRVPEPSPTPHVRCIRLLFGRQVHNFVYLISDFYSQRCDRYTPHLELLHL